MYTYRMCSSPWRKWGETKRHYWLKKHIRRQMEAIVVWRRLGTELDWYK